MKVAEPTKSLAPEQYGSRKRRQLKRAGAICSNDAKSCYDLIGHTQASLSMQRLGVPRSIINCLFTTLQEAIHKVRTGFGVSKAHYADRCGLYQFMELDKETVQAQLSGLLLAPRYLMCFEQKDTVVKLCVPYLVNISNLLVTRLSMTQT